MLPNLKKKLVSPQQLIVQLIAWAAPEILVQTIYIALGNLASHVGELWSFNKGGDNADYKFHT